LWASGWRPQKPNLKLEKDVVGFGVNLTGYKLVNFFFRNLDNALIGRYAGTASLGYYDRAYKLLLFPLLTINEPLSRVFIPTLSRMQDDKEKLRNVFLKICGLLTLATVPGVAALTIIPDEIIRLAFGDKWLPVAPIFVWLGLAGLLEPLMNATSWLFIAQGKTKTMFRWGTFSSMATIAAFVIGLPWGAVGVAAAYAISGYCLRMPSLLYTLHKMGPVKAIDLIKTQTPFLIAAALTWGITTYLFKETLSLRGLPLVLATGVLSYSLALTCSIFNNQGRQTLHEAYGLIKKSFPARVHTV